MPVFSTADGVFSLDGKPMTILSGAIHYFRTHPDQWRDRLEKLKDCGFNTVETYTPWNLHEKTPGKFDFTGMLDIGRFLDLAADVGLYAIVRPGPFICAEWEFGGMPADLLTDDDLRLRCRDARFIERQARYLQALLAHVVPRQVTRGGNVIMLQVENEYGSFGDDKVYMRKMRDVYLENGVDVPLFTSDGPVAFYLRSGTVEGTLATGNFGGHVAENAAQLKSLVPEGPHMCTEYWCGWFDHWGEPHHVRDAADAADTFAQLLDSGCSVNVYMFHGGTNFGFMNGANFQERYEPTTTSYDYDAVLSESGDLTDKFFAFRRVIEERFGALPPVRVKNSEKRAYGKVALDGCLPLAETLGAPVESAAPVDMEKLGQSYGYTLYRASFETFGEDVTLRVFNVRDRAIVFVDGVRVGVLYRRDGGEPAGGRRSVRRTAYGRAAQREYGARQLRRASARPEGDRRRGRQRPLYLRLGELPAADGAARRAVLRPVPRLRRAGVLRRQLRGRRAGRYLPRRDRLRQGLRRHKRLQPRPLLAGRGAAEAPVCARAGSAAGPQRHTLV